MIGHFFFRVNRNETSARAAKGRSDALSLSFC
jgi:hypothetical protein